MATDGTSLGIQKPENMAEVLGLAVTAQKALDEIGQADKERREGEQDKATRFVIKPTEGELVAELWEPGADGRNWIRSDSTKKVTADEPFEAATWGKATSGSHGFTFYTSEIIREEGKAIELAWCLNVAVSDLHKVEIVEMLEDEVVSIWPPEQGRIAVADTVRSMSIPALEDEPPGGGLG